MKKIIIEKKINGKIDLKKIIVVVKFFISRKLIIFSKLVSKLNQIKINKLKNNNLIKFLFKSNLWIFIQLFMI